MGKTKIKVFDESAQEEVKEKTSRKKAIEESSKGRLPPNAASPRLHTASGAERIRVRQRRTQAFSSEAQARRDASVGEPESGAADRSVKSDEQSTGPRATEKKPQKPGKAKPRSKKYQQVSKDLDRTKTYPIDQAVEMVKKLSYSKFAGTLEAHINTMHAGLRGLVSLPYAQGKKLRILAFGKSADTSGADYFGTDETIEEINKGKINFDLIITTPEWMPKIAKVAKILGPKGLMPNPKNSTIAEDLKKTVESFQSGKTEYKTEPKAPIIHLGLGKLNQPTEELSANVKTLLQTLGKTRIKQVRLAPTMGPSVKVDLTSL